MEEENKKEEESAFDKTGKAIASIWSTTIGGIDKGIDVTVAKSKEIGEKWDQSQTGQKINTGTKVAVEKTKEYSVKAWDATVDGLVKVKNSETV